MSELKKEELGRLTEMLLNHLDYDGENNSIATICRYHWDRVLKILEGAKVKPLVWEINPSGHCNLECSFCLTKPNKQMLPKEQFLNLLQQAIDLDAKAIIIAGEGEPLAHPDIEEILNKVKENGLDIFLFTNGTLIGKTVSPKTLINTCSMIIFGFYGATEKKYEEITGKNYFEDMVTNLSNLVDLRNSLSPELPKPALVGGWVAVESNMNEAYDIAELGKKIGLDWMYLRTDVTGDGFKDEASVIDLYDILSDLRRVHNKAEHSFIRGRLLFDRQLSFDVDHKDGVIALLHPGSKTWPTNLEWLSWNDIHYIGPDGKLKLSTRKDVLKNTATPFIVKSSYDSTLVDAIETIQTERAKYQDSQKLGGATGRKALVNLFYNILKVMDKTEREFFRREILDRYKSTIYSDIIKNYF